MELDNGSMGADRLLADMPTVVQGVCGTKKSPSETLLFESTAKVLLLG